jgi:quercetin dioxygenase-like cupin family protein
MRTLTAGIDDNGQTTIVAEVEYHHKDVSPEGEGRLSAGHPTRSSRIDFYKTTETPPTPLPSNAEFHDMEMFPGQVFFLTLMIPPEGVHPRHYTSSLNYHTVVSGDVDIVLDDGPHHLNEGDSLVLPGLAHGWKAGPSGCTMAIALVATEHPGT